MSTHSRNKAIRNRMKRLSAAALAWALLPAGLALGQTQGVLAGAGGGPTDFEVEPARSLFEVTTGTESSTASLRIGTQLSRPDTNKMGETGKISTFTTLAVTLAGPLDKSNDITDLATLDGLGNAIKAGFKANVFFVGLRNPHGRPEEEKLCDRLQTVMTAKGLLKPEEDVQCDASNIQEHLGSDALEEFYDLYYDDGGSWILGTEAKVGTQEYDYRNINTFDKESTNKVPWSAGGHVGYMHPTLGLTTAGFRYEQTYKEADKRTVCTPIDGSEQLECETGAAGRPKQKDSAIVFLSWRRHIPVLSEIEQFRYFAVGPRISFDAKDDTLGIDLPIYLWGTKSGLLNGGIRGGWRDDNEDFTFSVFVGSSFSYFN